MLFNSYSFIFLVLITFSLYYTELFKYHQIYILILSSAIFYGYSQPYLLVLLFLSASVNAITSYITFFCKNKKLIAIVGVIFNLLVLAFFKYNKLIDGITYDITAESGQFLSFIVTLPLPIGISFYTFQGISLVMDVYKPYKKLSINISKNFFRHYRNTLFFISFFPQLIAGPIVRAHDFFPQISIKNIKKLDFDYIFRTLILGYFLKSVIADNLKDQTFWIAAPYFESQSSLTLLVMLFGYSVQIFADFAGYSLIAIGVAALFGYKLPQNFDFPYISGSISEFWKRWHISLSSWLKEYLYIGFLGGNRKGNIRTYVNLIIVMFLGGLWHGAALSYGIWGLWHGIGLIIERKFKITEMNKKAGLISVSLRVAFVFSFVSFGWLLFKLTDIQDAIDYLTAIKRNVNIRHSYAIIINIVVYSLPVVLYHMFYLAKKNYINILRTILMYDYVIYAIMIVMIFINGGISGEFVYFQF